MKVTFRYAYGKKDYLYTCNTREWKFFHTSISTRTRFKTNDTRGPTFTDLLERWMTLNVLFFCCLRLYFPIFPYRNLPFHNTPHANSFVFKTQFYLLFFPFRTKTTPTRHLCFGMYAFWILEMHIAVSARSILVTQQQRKRCSVCAVPKPLYLAKQMVKLNGVYDAKNYVCDMPRPQKVTSPPPGPW